LGDKIETTEIETTETETIERPYAPFFTGVREKVRRILENHEGRKELARKRQAPQQKGRKFNEISGRACKPESSSAFVFSISCIESTKAICQ